MRIAVPRIPVDILDAADVVGRVHKDADVDRVALDPRDVVAVGLHLMRRGEARRVG